MAYLSFSERFNSNLKFEAEDAESAELFKNDLPLKYTWTVWEQIDSSGKPGQYKDATRKVASFSTVQQFWTLWNHIPQPSGLLEQKRMVHEQHDGALHAVEALMIFRENVRPEWEDEMNSSGGHFQYLLKPNLGGGQIDEFWNNVVLGMVGATVKPAHMITGVRLVDKLSGARAANVLRLEIWYCSNSSAQEVAALKKNVEKCLAHRLDGSSVSTPKCEIKGHQAK
mmetsp:Transcript_30881/g.67619  ORF Transcript_30881/g.67619 Transcript_30881/m.67619 type:complete len:226 (-) Transcript_30881:200-877(-)|eukprot:CAMPEP_0170620436 /NCGR_PEP_ID=MMETSP0224-20130122/28056_1 /TAXON_ID=285029 /ORGANISM="Togula jolla, Strain CCCM 725" /LENGTH=225 /DNA_ID=CAMNT_0010946607 /DNA_START=102 /DNA_END=779 /DNA_ORIENTATION=-